MSIRRRTFVIVGGGLAGATAALKLRQEGFDGRVLVLCDEEHPPYSRPPLSKQFVRGEFPAEKTHIRPARMWDSKEVELLLGCAATAIDAAAHRVSLADGSAISYDKLLIATGGRPRRLPGMDGVPGVHALRTIGDALRLRDHLAEGRSLAVIGAGFIGAELAASAVAVGAPIAVLEALPRPLARVLPPALSEHYAQLHRARGVDLRTGHGAARFRAGGAGVVIEDGNGRQLEADAVVVAIGIELNLSLARQAGLQLANGIVVDELCRTSAPDIYAAGDIANHPNALLGRRIRIEHWQNAQHQGAAAARAMLGGSEPFAEVPWVWSEQYEFNLQIAGLPEPGDTVVVRGDADADEFSAFLLREGRLAAVVGINRPEEVRAGRALIAQRISPSPRELADSDFDLAALSSAEAVA